MLDSRELLFLLLLFQYVCDCENCPLIIRILSHLKQLNCRHTSDDVANSTWIMAIDVV